MTKQQIKYAMEDKQIRKHSRRDVNIVLVSHALLIRRHSRDGITLNVYDIF